MKIKINQDVILEIDSKGEYAKEYEVKIRGFKTDMCAGTLIYQLKDMYIRITDKEV